MGHIYFLCHCSEDEAEVLEVRRRLGNESCWFKGVRIGLRIMREISNGIAACSVFVLFWSRHADACRWVEEECSQAVMRLLREDDEQFRLVVVRLDDTELPPELDSRASLDIRRGVDSVVEGLKTVARSVSQAPSSGIAGPR